jgi:hypothetical protein
MRRHVENLETEDHDLKFMIVMFIHENENLVQNWRRFELEHLRFLDKDAVAEGTELLVEQFEGQVARQTVCVQ